MLAIDTSRPAERHHPDRVVPAQWRGRARLLCQKVLAHAVEVERAAEVILQPIRPRPGFLPIPKRNRLEWIANAWRAQPRGISRLRSVVSYEPGRLQICELRLTPVSVVGDETWQGREELGLGVALFEACCSPPEPYGDRETVVAIAGLHAIGRCFQRAPDRRDERVLADLAALAEGGLRALARGLGEFEIPTASGGRWIGAVQETGCMVRTFVRGRR
jgi:hypothetical protein